MGCLGVCIAVSALSTPASASLPSPGFATCPMINATLAVTAGDHSLVKTSGGVVSVLLAGRPFLVPGLCGAASLPPPASAHPLLSVPSSSALTILQAFPGELPWSLRQGLTSLSPAWSSGQFRSHVCHSEHLPLTLCTSRMELRTFFLKNTLSISLSCETQGHPSLTPTPALDKSAWEVPPAPTPPAHPLVSLSRAETSLSLSQLPEHSWASSGCWLKGKASPWFSSRR